MKATFVTEKPMAAEFEETHQYTPIVPPAPVETVDLLWEGSVQAPVATTTVHLDGEISEYRKIGIYTAFSDDKYGGYGELPVSIICDHPGQKNGFCMFERYAPVVQYDTETSLKIGSSAWNGLVTFKAIYGIR